jgi:predicted small lipoprotein YifL
MRDSRWLAAPGVVVICLLLVLSIAGCGSKTVVSNPNEKDAQYQTIFTDPATKLAETSSQQFTEELYDEAVAYEPLIEKKGTQVYMGYWSAKGNHGSLVRVLDAVNEGPATTPPQKAIWDEGATSSNQYPSYDTMLEEHWYDRDNEKNGKVSIFGVTYTDLHPVTEQQANDIWGQYSQRYADMAKLIKRATGIPVKAVCFIQGAKANRVFYTYELPELKTLEASGDATVYFATSQDADPATPADWIQGTQNAPAPVPAQ